MMGFGALGQLALAEVDEGAASISIYGIAYDLSQPVQVRARLIPGAQPAFLFQPTPIISIGWYAPMAEPKRFVKALPVADQPFYQAEPEPEELDVEAWFARLSEPKRFPARLLAGTQPFYLFQPTPIIQINWLTFLAEPKRFPRGLPFFEQHYYEAEPEPEELDLETWWKPFSEPQRFPKRLHAALNPAVFPSAKGVLYVPYARGYVIT